MRRVARRVVIFQWDDKESQQFWLIRDYLPEYHALGRDRPDLSERTAAIGARVETVLIPWDCVDGFFHCYWRRPKAYLTEAVRRGSSVWARVGAPAEQRAVGTLGADLASVAWCERNRELAGLESADLGARLLIASGANTSKIRSS